MTHFYKKYLELCAKHGKSASGVASAIGLSNAAASGWKSGKQPSDITLEKLADYFKVTVEELKEEQKENPTKQTLGEVIPNYSDLSTDNQKKVRDFIDALLTVQQTQ